MISVIICSRTSLALSAIEENIAATIGIPYKLIAIDNSKGQYGICEAYNIGAAKSKYDLLCFMHEDIRFHTIGWGRIVAETLADPTIGVLGVTGGQWQVAAPAAWWGCGLELCREHIVNVYEDGRTELDFRNPEGAMLADAAVVDGLWMCSRKEVWEKCPFDAQTFTQFHFYDIDYCTEIFRQDLRVCITFQILLEHHSRGSVNDSWLHNALKYQQKRLGQLPFGVATLSQAQQDQMELRALHEFAGRIIRARFPARTILRYLVRCFKYNPFNRDTLWLAKLWLRNGRQ